MMKMMKGVQTDHSQQVASGRQPAVVRNLHAISSQMRQLSIFNGHLETSNLHFKTRPEPLEADCSAPPPPTPGHIKDSTKGSYLLTSFHLHKPSKYYFR